MTMKVNFKQIKFFTGIDHKESIVQDISLELANMVYRNSDIRGLRLAEKIYNSEEETELTEEETAFLRELINRHGTAMMVDAFNNIFDYNSKK